MRLLPILIARFLVLGLTVDGATAKPAAVQVAVAAVDRSSGSTLSAHPVTLRGTGLDRVRTVVLGETRLAVTARTSTSPTVVVPAAARFQPATAAFALLVGDRRVATRSTWTWRATGAAAKELRYVGAYIRARGLPFTAAWSPGSPAWVSSTRLRAHLPSTGRFVELADTRAGRAEVRIGDVIQFDWDRSGDRDHTGVVTRIDRLADGDVAIRYSAHTDARPPHEKNEPSWNLSIATSIRNHRLVYDLPVTGTTTFLHVVR